MGISAECKPNHGNCLFGIAAGHTLVGESNNWFPHQKHRTSGAISMSANSTTGPGLTLRDQRHHPPAPCKLLDACTDKSSDALK
ncbi:hypothetical protein HMPREF0290_2803 [Corynebacterium efficiens YS-314]|nr:hypothetical protein HMPREF0290_2803 [Corynebacterium efficiens YS-314]